MQHDEHHKAENIKSVRNNSQVVHGMGNVSSCGSALIVAQEVEIIASWQVGLFVQCLLVCMLSVVFGTSFIGLFKFAKFLLHELEMKEKHFRFFVLHVIG